PDCARLVASGASADLYCIPLIPAPGYDAHGSVELGWVPGPFTVAVSPGGVQGWNLLISAAGLDRKSRGGRSGFVAWASPPSLTPLVRLGVMGTGPLQAGPVAFDRFLVLISAEADTATREMRGKVVLRGESPSNRLRPADTYQFFLGALTPRAATGDHMNHQAQHGDGSQAWVEAPMYPGLDMLPSEMALRPAEAPWLPAPDPAAPAARPREVVQLKNGDTLDLTAGVVRRSIAGRDYTMFGFNGQYPGPLIAVTRGSTVTVRVNNQLSMPTTVHWHGVRLDNRYDGVPDAAHPPVAPGETFAYQLRFPDEGLFWYHPHVREDIQQDLGLYGNIFVLPAGADPVPGPSESFLILDDLLIGDAGLVPYGAETPTHAAMGRFGNVMLVNGETAWNASARANEPLRLHLTNVSNTRTFNLSFGSGARITVVSSDLGEFAHQAAVESVVIAPAERYTIDVSFEKAGRYTLVNRVRAIDHLYGRFFDAVDTLGAVAVTAGATAPRASAAPAPGRDAEEMLALARANVGLPPQHTLELSARFTSLPFVSEQLMRLDSIYFNPVEWEGTMPGMNQATTGRQAHWILRDPDTGAENMDVHWTFRQGELVRLRLVGTRNTLHGMHHPIHIHGQRFLVLAVNGTPNENPVWKDTVLLPAAGALDLLVEMSNPGTWMLHCHIAEHLQAGMMTHFDVEDQ
ncbi:MAG: Multicopper oxidase type 3, partial [Gemmatimonadetes bacterium]|nr:Multicopper oxidase type 3 [Gemmatimonadota bacterium]